MKTPFFKTTNTDLPQSYDIWYQFLTVCMKEVENGFFGAKSFYKNGYY